MSRSRTARRKLLVPEVIQTSAMDCGPACLKAMLAGWGGRASYDRLREACQTEVDGTSIDAVEELAGQLGADAEQVLVPADHVLMAEADALPAIAVLRQPDGNNHFSVLWRRHGPLVQVMDPAVGRRWMSASALERDLYVHEMELPVEAWREWASGDDFVHPLRKRLRTLGADVEASLERALADDGWRGLAGLDAAARMVQSLVDARAVRRGAAAGGLVATLVGRLAEGGDGAIPDGFWSVRPTEHDPDSVRVRGAVLVRVGGYAGAPPDAQLSPELAAALREPDRKPLRELAGLVRDDGWLTPGMLLLGFALAAAGLVVEAVLFRSLFDIGDRLGAFEQRLGAAVALLVFMAALLFIELPLAAGVRRIGRQVEARLRLAFLAKLPKIALRYFHSRPTSDMAERSHSIHRLRDIPTLGGHVVRAGSEVVLTTAGLVWLAPSSAPLSIALGLAVIVVPLLAQQPLLERELRVRTHAGALSRFYLDALLGVIPVRTHGVERPMRREHEWLLADWARAGLSALRVAVVANGVQAFAALALAAWLVIDHLRGSPDPTSALLLIYWALTLPLVGQEIAIALREHPTQRSLALRLLEPLGALELPDAELAEAAADEAPGGEGVEVELEAVTVRAAGHVLLEEVSLSIRPGEHVAVVGPSGAGKSTLVGLLLGWTRPSAGAVRVDGEPLSPAMVARLRTQTAWLDPAVQLWNRSVIDNLRYGADPAEPTPLADITEAAQLDGVLERLPDGMQTSLGEGGCLVSGGEGQRVRLGRALHRGRARLAILDEPFRGLDRDARRALLAEARRRWAGATLVCVTHDIGETRDFERVVVVDGGHVVDDGPPAELEASDTLYARLLAAEREAAARWREGGWRRVRVEGGRVVEGGAS